MFFSRKKGSFVLFGIIYISLLHQILLSNNSFVGKIATSETDTTHQEVQTNDTNVYVDPSLGLSLWKGDFFPINNTIKVTASEITTTNSFAVVVVISHCTDSIEWLKEYVKGDQYEILDIFVISKCNKTVEGLPENSSVIRLPNVGRCDHSYAYWMTNETTSTNAYYKDETIVLFLKDTFVRGDYWFASRSLSDLIKIVSQRGFACGSSPIHFSYYHDVGFLGRFTLSNYERLSRDRGASSFFKSNFTNLHEWWNATNSKPTQPVTPVCYKGNFATTIERIHSFADSRTSAGSSDNKNNIWFQIQNFLSRGDNIEESHFAERSWATLLSKNISSNEVNALRQLSSSKVDRALAGFSGALLQGKAIPE